MSIDPYCDSNWSSIEYFDFSHDKKYGSVCRVPYGEDTDSFDEAINTLDGHSGCKCTHVPLKNPYQIHQSRFQY